MFGYFTKILAHNRRFYNALSAAKTVPFETFLKHDGSPLHFAESITVLTTIFRT